MPQEKLVSLFSQQSCWMIKPLATAMGYSVPSIRRFLGEIGYYSSFTHNGKWYTLRTTPHFNRDGIWFFDVIGFSRAGSLTNTLINLIIRSQAGVTAEQLGVKLRCRCHSVLVQLYRQGKIQRQKQGRSYIYLAIDPSTQAIQLQALEGKNRPLLKLPAEIAVLILAEFIRQPDLSFEQLAKSIARHRRIVLDAPQVEELFALHGLKKTIQTAVPKP
ncbi:MAG: hypothetical protein U9R66_01550 [Thermodesulfobacteriota bacterium]|nr:hypothetical protein [Thermodesulfobacteriota bacterium]